MLVVFSVLSFSKAQAGKRQSSGNEGAMPEWSEWEACSKPCGNGTRTRQLNCSTATGPCDSSVFETQDCNTRVCPAGIIDRFISLVEDTFH